MAHGPYFSKKIVFSLKYRDNMRVKFVNMWLEPFTWTVWQKFWRKCGSSHLHEPLFTTILANFLEKCGSSHLHGPFDKIFGENVARVIYMNHFLRLFEQIFWKIVAQVDLHGPLFTTVWAIFLEKMWLKPFTWTTSEKFWGKYGPSHFWNFFK